MNRSAAKRLCLLLAALLLLPCLLGAAAGSAASSAPPVELLLGDGRDRGEFGPEGLIRSFALPDGSGLGFVIPGYWDASALRIVLSGVESVQIGGRSYRSGDPIALALNEKIEVLPDGQEPVTVELRQTGGVPALFLETESGSSEAIHADKTYREPGCLRMIGAEGELLYEGELSAIRSRGNATFRYEKKPYQITLVKSAALAGPKKDKTWVLLANIIDRSQIRTTLAFDLARRSCAFVFTPCTQPADLYLNGEYRGTYVLTEKQEVEKNRLPITDLEKAVKALNPDLDFTALPAQGDAEYAPDARKWFELPAEPGDLTGGYLFQINFLGRYPTEASAFATSRGCVFTVQEPKYLSLAQMEYLSALVQQLEDALFSEDGVDPASGKHYTELLDLPSFVNKYLMAEVLNDFDGQYSYFYKDADAVDPMIYAGPVWDQDNILGVWKPRSDPAVLHLSAQEQTSDRFWFTQASRHADFMEAAREAYLRSYRPAILILLGRETDPQGILRSIDEYAAEVRISAETDFFRWPFPFSPELKRYNLESGSSFDGQIAFLKDYLSVRLGALDAYFLGEEQPD
ncbi:MAG: CotH kinase family protein [Oscillospiraceae bacterium]|nr:CotH kinase family protein [Oscillospiraceae bacterium]